MLPTSIFHFQVFLLAFVFLCVSVCVCVKFWGIAVERFLKANTQHLHFLLRLLTKYIILSYTSLFLCLKHAAFQYFSKNCQPWQDSNAQLWDKSMKLDMTKNFSFISISSYITLPLNLERILANSLFILLISASLLLPVKEGRVLCLREQSFSEASKHR